MAKKRYYDYMDKYDKKKMRNKNDMITEDYSKTANLPQDVVMREYPKMDYGANLAYDDTRSDMDRQMGNDARAWRKKKAKKRY